jgi:hypothetical protein
MQERAIGHFNITRVHCNGTLTIRRSAHVTERIDIRRLRPFKINNNDGFASWCRRVS